MKARGNLMGYILFSALTHSQSLSGEDKVVSFQRLGAGNILPSRR